MRAFGLLGVVIVLAVGIFLYQRNIQELPDENPLQTIDTVAMIRAHGAIDSHSSGVPLLLQSVPAPEASAASGMPFVLQSRKYSHVSFTVSAELPGEPP